MPAVVPSWVLSLLVCRLQFQGFLPGLPSSTGGEPGIYSSLVAICDMDALPLQDEPARCLAPGMGGEEAMGVRVSCMRRSLQRRGGSRWLLLSVPGLDRRSSSLMPVMVQCNLSGGTQ